MSINELPLETRNINDLMPIGYPTYSFVDTLPNGNFTWVEGQEFDVLELTELAKMYPSGILPDPRWDFFRIVPRDQEVCKQVEQSVQPLTFIGDALPNHQHQAGLKINRLYGTDGGFGFGYVDIGGVGFSFREYVSTCLTPLTNMVSAGTPTGTIGGTGGITAPRHMQVYCMMRIK